MKKVFKVYESILKGYKKSCRITEHKELCTCSTWDEAMKKVKELKKELNTDEIYCKWVNEKPITNIYKFNTPASFGR